MKKRNNGRLVFERDFVGYHPIDLLRALFMCYVVELLEIDEAKYWTNYFQQVIEKNISKDYVKVGKDIYPLSVAKKFLKNIAKTLLFAKLTFLNHCSLFEKVAWREDDEKIAYEIGGYLLKRRLTNKEIIKLSENKKFKSFHVLSGAIITALRCKYLNKKIMSVILKNMKRVVKKMGERKLDCVIKLTGNFGETNE